MIDYNLTQIRALAFDVDGVLSSNLVMLFDNEQPHRTANIKDGYALQHAVKSGLHLAIITGGKSIAVQQRYEALGIPHIYMSASVKIKEYNKWLNTVGLKPQEVIYMGDDIPDFEIMKHCGCPCCPADAAAEIRQISKYVSPFKGGEGCVRDVLEQVLRAQNKWMSSAEAFGW